MEIGHRFKELDRKLLEELSGNSVYLTVDAQNHLFGCLSVLEAVDDCEEIEMDLSGEFARIGCEYGFIGAEGGAKDFTGFCENYRAIIGDLIEIVRQNAGKLGGSIEELEEGCYNFYLVTLGAGCPFVNAVGMVEAEAEAETEAEAEAEVKPETGSKRSHSKTLRRKRALTPIYRRKGYNKTLKSLNGKI
jgi:hypothetical protein